MLITLIACLFNITKKKWLNKMFLLATANQFSTAGMVSWRFLVATANVIIIFNSSVIRVFAQAAEMQACLFPPGENDHQAKCALALYREIFFPITMTNGITLPSQAPENENSQCLITLSPYSPKLTS